MKILSMAWTVYDNRIKEFAKDCTGGGLVIKNICEYIGKTEESYLFIGNCHLSEQKIGNINIIGTNYQIDENDNDLIKDDNYLRNMAKKFELTIEKLHPDIVNFHGIGVLMQYCIKICIKRKIPYVYTEHLYIGLQRNIENYSRVVEWEKRLYNIPELQIIAVSHGMKKKILEDFPQIPDTRIHVIPNGTDFTAEYIEHNDKKKYKLDNKKILLCVGTILARKNQIQLISVYSKLPDEIRNNLKIIFCGKDGMKGKLQDNIESAGLECDLICVGAISSEEMKEYYSIADGLIMPSLAEGLSIAALEAISYGLPIIMFEDSECVDDLNDDNVVCLAKYRSDDSMLEAVEKWYRRKWDKQYIKNYSKYFSMERMAEDYINYYKMRLK